MKAKMDSMKTLMDQGKKCFTDNGCQDKPPMGGHHGGPKGGRGGKHGPKSSEEGSGSEVDAATRNQTHQCLKAVFEKRRQSIETSVSTCVQAAISPLVMPQHQAEDHQGGPHGGPGGFPHGGPGGPHGGGPGGRGGKMNPQKMIEAACVNSTVANAASNVETCLNSSMQSDLELLRTFCAAKNACMTTFTSAGCAESDIHSAMENVMNATRICMKQEIEKAKASGTTPEASAADVTECAGLNLTKVFEKSSESSSEEHGNGRPSFGSWSQSGAGKGNWGGKGGKDNKRGKGPQAFGGQGGQKQGGFGGGRFGHDECAMFTGQQHDFGFGGAQAGGRGGAQKNKNHHH